MLLHGRFIFWEQIDIWDLMSDLFYSFYAREVRGGTRKFDQVWLLFGSCDLYEHGRPWLLAGMACSTY